jgi:hypothetical protein
MSTAALALTPPTADRPRERLPLRCVAGCVALMGALVVAFAVQRPVLIVACTALCAALVLASGLQRRVTRSQLLLFVGVCVVFAPAFLKPYHGLSPIYYFLSTVVMFFTADVIARQDPRVLLMALRLLYAAAVTFVAWVAFTYWGHPEPFGEVIPGSSTNAIPSYLIVLQVALSLATYVVRRRLPLLSPLLTFAIAFLGLGRGSLVIAAAIIGATVVLNLFASAPGRPFERLWHGALALAAAVALWMHGDGFLETVSNYTKLSVGLVDTNRLEIIDDYFARIDGLTLLLGADYAGTIVEHTYGGNPHLAYVRTHSFFGLAAVVLAMASPLAVWLARRAWTARLVFFTFIALAALRAVSEPIFFPTVLDFFYFLYFMLLRHLPSAAAAAAAAGAVRATHNPTLR